ncbi:MAG: hypothetical protein U0531_01880 [Dehalococcoidia bacterium]
MDRAEFTNAMPGDLVQIPDGCAFVPAPLPVGLPPDWPLLRAAERARGALLFAGEAAAE